ncbi:MAG: phage/plasmid primase, P4 family [Candidatus Methanoperedens sp.]|nr:phage/plasmid primase, P4 family [Candidatus Methanoperedens sp.]
MFTELDAIKRLTIRRSCYWKQNTKPDKGKDGKDKYGYTHVKKPLTNDDILKSINTNTFTIGTATTENGTNLCVAPTLDIDSHKGEEVRGKLKALYDESIKQGFTPIIEASGGDDIEGGAHLIFPCKPTLSAWVRPTLRGIIHACGLDIKDIEIFPKQDEVKEDGYGNFVKTIFQFNNRTGERSTIINPDTMQPFSRQDAINHVCECPNNVFPEIPEYETPIQTINEATTATTEPIKSNMDFEELFGDIDIKPCVKKAYIDKWVLHGRGSQGHDFRLAAVGELLDYDIEDELIHEYFRIQSDYNQKATQKGIDSAKKHKADNGRPMGCKKIIEKCSQYVKGICETCEKKPKERKQREPKTKGIKADVNEVLEAGFGAYRNNMELVEEFQKIAHVLYDISKNFWLWIPDMEYYKRIDDIDILSAIRKRSDEYVIETTKAGEIKRAIQITGRERLNTLKDIKETWVHTKNGIIDYLTGERIKASPEYFLKCPIPHKIGNSGEIPKIDKLFNDWLGDRKQILYEILAYCLVDSYPIHRMFILFGSGRNGKSQFLELLTRFIGRENTTSTELEKIIDSRFECSKLYRKKAALIGETNFTAIKSSDRIKKITGHDMLTAEYKGKDPFDFQNTAKICIATNSVPETLDKTEAFHSRCIIIEFKNRFDEGKPVIDLIPEYEYENLLYKCVKILPELIGGGKFTNEGTIEEKAEKYERLSNPFPTFKNKELIEDGGAQTPIWTIRDMYISFCAKNGFRKIGDRDFTQLLHKEGYETKRAWYGKKNWNTVFGLTTKEPYIYEEEDGKKEGENKPDEPDEPDSSIRTPYRELNETSGSSGSSGSKQAKTVTELSQKEKMNEAFQLIYSHYGSQPISKAGIQEEAKNLAVKLNIPFDDALQYIKQAISDRDRGR